MWSRLYCPALVVVAITALPGQPCFADLVIDQQQLVRNAGFGFGARNNTGQQEVIAGLAGTLAGFDFVSNGIGNASSVQVDVFVKLGGAQSGSTVFQGSVTVTSGDVGSFFFVDTSSAGIQVTSGTLFTIGIIPRGGFDLGVGVNNPYTQGGFFFNSAAQSSDMTFRTYVAAVPEPAGFTVFGTGALFLVVGLWRHRRATA